MLKSKSITGENFQGTKVALGLNGEDVFKIWDLKDFRTWFRAKNTYLMRTFENHGEAYGH